MRERGERGTHPIPGIHRLSRGEEASDLIKVTIPGSGVDGPSGTSERGRGRAHDETRGCSCSAHTAPTHTTPQGLVGWARGWEIERARGGEKKRTGLMAGRRGVWKLKEKRGTGGTSDDKRRRAD
jgi:hypothetical protein